MLSITKTETGTSLVYVLEGRLDTTTATQLESEIKVISESVTSLEFDFAKLEYISSAGLRVLLASQKLMNKQGTMKIRNVNSTIREVFDITGFSDIMNIE